MEKLSQAEIQRLVRLALEEDCGDGDVTTLATVPREAQARAVMVAHQPAVIAGLEFAATAFKELNTEAKIDLKARDGEHVAARTPLLTVAGRAQPVLTAERIALNFVQRLSGIATLTAKFVEAVKGTKARIWIHAKPHPDCAGPRNMPWLVAADRITVSVCSTWC